MAVCQRLTPDVFYISSLMLTNRGWVVYCQDTDTVIGHWNDYKDAEQFWLDSLLLPNGNLASDYDWAVFPALECAGLLEV